MCKKLVENHIHSRLLSGRELKATLNYQIFLRPASLIFFLAFSLASDFYAQDSLTWDDTRNQDWPEAFAEVQIKSSMDGKLQKAYFFRSSSTLPQPLIVSLHTWSGDYRQKDPLVQEIMARNWNYIHPDFRGSNNTPEAMGSPLVISDIEDAIEFAIQQSNTIPEEVHLVGVSGGGYATLLAYMEVGYPVKSFSAWAPISDIAAWYHESVGRQQKYAGDILSALQSDSLHVREAQKRSPINLDFPIQRRKNSTLYIYTGIHDGYTGSVPITHAIKMYNRLVAELKYDVTDPDQIMRKASFDQDLVPPGHIISLVTKRTNPDRDINELLFDRQIQLSIKYQNVHLLLFEGGHEQLPQALGLIPINPVSKQKATILTLGDSNAEHAEGWVGQLQEMMPLSQIINHSQSGRTIGFDNNGNPALNTLRNITRYLDEVATQLAGDPLDFIILCLGTNDTKKEFADRQDEVVENFNLLLDRIADHPISQGDHTRLIFLTPPPIRTYEILEKYQGGNERLADLVPKLSVLAQQKGFEVLDVYFPLQGILDNYAPDGVHMRSEGQKIIATRLLDLIESSPK